MRPWIVLSALLLPFVTAPSQAAQDAMVLENHPRAYSFSFGDDDSTGAYLGVDSVRLRERWHKQRPALGK